MIGRALHFVLKVGNLKHSMEFFRIILGMQVLRHEVFDQGCEAACNGPYDGKWSKTMIGYGPEDDHFVLELTYNYTVANYKLGNDLQYIRMGLNATQYDKVKDSKYAKLDGNDLTLISPDGYKFLVEKGEKNTLTEVCLACSDLNKSTDYWNKLLKMETIKGAKESDEEVVLKYGKEQAALRLRKIKEEIDHKSAYGRIAFSCPSQELKPLEKLVEEAKYKILTPYVSLDTPGKASVQVVILADPDGHEICFVGDEGFRELSKVDPKADELLDKSLAEDKSDEWFQKKNKSKSEA